MGFRSLHLRYEEEKRPLEGEIRLWPASYSEQVPYVDTDTLTLAMHYQDDSVKSLSWDHLTRLPTTNEIKEIHSRSGWMYQGFWNGISFQTLINLLPPTVAQSPWVKLESFNGTHCVLPQSALASYRILLKCDEKPLSTLYGGPLWVHCFDHYVEYALPHLKAIHFLTGDHEAAHPGQDKGFSLEDMRVETGRYYVIHKGRSKHFRYV